MDEEPKKHHRKSDSNVDSGGDTLSIGDEIGCFVQLLKAVWWVIKLPFKIIAMVFSSGGDGD